MLRRMSQIYALPPTAASSALLEPRICATKSPERPPAPAAAFKTTPPFPSPIELEPKIKTK